MMKSPPTGAPLKLTIEGHTSTKKYRVQNLNNQQCVEASYRKNNKKETDFLALAVEYETNFKQKYPTFTNRLYLKAQNEFKVTKCVCSTIRPHLLPYPSIHDAESCSEFIAHYMAYEPLEDMISPPDFLPSPTQALKWGVGDCFDLSIILVSLLIGSGYDAYVVYGIASEKMCRREFKEFSIANNRVVDIERTLDSIKSITSCSKCQDDQFCPFDTSHNQDENETSDDNADTASQPSFGRDTFDRQRLHCWVMIKPGMRSPLRPGSYFIEPSTGDFFTLEEASNSIYLQIFAMWNATNYWVNLSSDGLVAQVDLSDSDIWESVFDHNLSHTITRSRLDSSLAKMNPGPPPSWVGKLEIALEAFEIRYPPHGSRMILYDKAKVELFSKGYQNQNLVKKITMYDSNDENKNVLQYLEYFGENRRDCLIARVRMPMDMSLYESFSMKHPHSLEERMEISGKKRILKFRSRGRSDRLISSDETIGERIVDSYVDRHDGLIRRVIHFRNATEVEGSKESQVLLLSIDSNKSVIVSKIIESYERRTNDKNHFSDSFRQIATRTILFEDKKKIEITYYNNEGKISNEKSIFEDSFHTGIENGQVLINAVRSTLASLRKLQQEMSDIVNLRKNEELKQKGCTNREKSHEKISSPKKDLGNDHDFDYLHPFLVDITDPQNISEKEAICICDSYLNNLKSKIHERENILHEKVQEYIVQFANVRISNSLGKDEDAFQTQCNSLLNRIKILLRRQEEYETDSTQKYEDAKEKVQSDPRLSKAKNKDNIKNPVHV